MRSEAPPAGSGNTRLGLAVLALAPALGAMYASALVERRRFATPRAAREALERLGLGELARGTLEVRPLGTGKSNAVIAVRLDGGRQVVLKKALSFGSLMAWGARHFGANYIYAPATSGRARIDREAAALRFLATSGVTVPACLGASAEHGLLALEWVECAPAATALHGPGGLALAGEVGALIGRVHRLGVTLADGHPGNILVGANGLVLFDLEFAEVEGSTAARRGFDLAYAAVLMPTDALRDAMVDAYGTRTAAELDAFDIAERHLRRFRRLLEMERARWQPAR